MAQGVKCENPLYLLQNYYVDQNGCHTHKGTCYNGGYGRITSKHIIKEYSVTSLHQLAYIVANGFYNKNLYVCHKCNNKKCINVSHLYLGTAWDNAQDAIRDGVLCRFKGETNAMSKLTENQVIKIKN